MQNKNFKELTNEQFLMLLHKAPEDNEAMEKILDIFEDDINSVCKYVKMPKEDLTQELYTELISVIRKKKSKTHLCPGVS